MLIHMYAIMHACTACKLSVENSSALLFHACKTSLVVLDVCVITVYAAKAVSEKGW